MRGVYAVAAELSRRGFVVAVTSRGAKGSDLILTDPAGLHTFSVQVKANAVTFNFWNMNKDTPKYRSPTHIYVLANFRRIETEFYVVPSDIIADAYKEKARPGSIARFVDLVDVKDFRNRWDLFGIPVDVS